MQGSSLVVCVFASVCVLFTMEKSILTKPFMPPRPTPNLSPPLPIYGCATSGRPEWLNSLSDTCESFGSSRSADHISPQAADNPLTELIPTWSAWLYCCVYCLISFFLWRCCRMYWCNTLPRVRTDCEHKPRNRRVMSNKMEVRAEWERLLWQDVGLRIRIELHQLVGL